MLRCGIAPASPRFEFELNLETNTFCNLRQIYFWFWQTWPPLEHRCAQMLDSGSKLSLWIWTQSWDKYIKQFETNTFGKPDLYQSIVALRFGMIAAASPRFEFELNLEPSVKVFPIFEMKPAVHKYFPNGLSWAVWKPDLYHLQCAQVFFHIPPVSIMFHWKTIKSFQSQPARHKLLFKWSESNAF